MPVDELKRLPRSVTMESVATCSAFVMPRQSRSESPVTIVVFMPYRKTCPLIELVGQPAGGVEPCWRMSDRKSHEPVATFWKTLVLSGTQARKTVVEEMASGPGESVPFEAEGVLRSVV